MLSRKPLQQCASCEKDLVNMSGKRAKYEPWGKIPYREPTEKLMRANKGYSNMLSQFNSSLDLSTASMQ